ncbi:MAG: sensor histidine kinase [Rehaibacterium terrae]|uniref:sensor histidine kinase n=1 Tax=Rehaibacterium terrae TaxID=1341696 RepID=UPI00391DAE67
MNRRTLRARIATGLLGYALLMAAAIFLHGYIVNEAVERTVWRSLLETELDYFQTRRAADPRFEWPQTETLALYRRPLSETASAHLPLALERLPPGLHDEVALDDHEVVVLVRDIGDERVYLTLDISDLEREERRLLLLLVGGSLLAAGLLAVLAWVVAGRQLRPVTRLAAAVDALRPDQRGQRLELTDDAPAEIATIAGAMNQYLERHERFVRREREFVDSVSHELRTPIAVIAGAAELIAARPDLPAAAVAPLRRIRQTARGVEQLIDMLLVLAKEPKRLSSVDQRFRLEELLPEIVLDHEHLTRDKALRLQAGPFAPTLLSAPLQVVQVAVGNLLRNAIENSDHGTIELRVEPAGVVRIRDPGQGMTPEEVGRIYAALARRGEWRVGAGIGLELIRRICEHLGWRLDIETGPGRGTLAVLDLRASLVSEGDAGGVV